VVSGEGSSELTRNGVRNGDTNGDEEEDEDEGGDRGGIQRLRPDEGSMEPNEIQLAI